MKDLLVNSLFNNYRKSNSLEMLWKIQKIRDISKILNYLKGSESEVVALLSDDKESKTLFQIACLLTGTNYAVFDKHNFEAYLVVMLKVKTLFVDVDHENLIGLRPLDIFSGSFIDNLIDFNNYRVYASKYLDVEDITDNVRNVSAVNTKEYSAEIEDLEKSFYEDCVKEHSYSTIFVIHPGVSTLTPKISVFNTESLFKGVLKIIDELYYDIAKKNVISVKHENLPVLNIQILEDVALPYVFLNGVILSSYSKGKYSFKLEKHNYNVLLISTDYLSALLKELTDENPFTSWLDKMGFNWLLSKILKYKFLKESKDLKLLILYGAVSKKLQMCINALDLKVVYMYTMTEVASFVSFEFYKKFPVKKSPTVGVLPKNVVLNSSVEEESSEILISTEDRMLTYTDTEFTTLCSMSEKYIGMHGTLDIGKNVDGKLQVQGKADEIFKNENGLVIQKDLIYSIALNNYFVRDVLLIVDTNKLYLLVELKIGALLYENKSMTNVQAELSTKTLRKINNAVEPYSQVEDIVIVPRGFRRNKGKIKASDYLL